VRRNWHAETGTEQPNDPNAMIAAYFDDVLESYEITEATRTMKAHEERSRMKRNQTGVTERGKEA
jgi:hypothetical protein